MVRRELPKDWKSPLLPLDRECIVFSHTSLLYFSYVAEFQLVLFRVSILSQRGIHVGIPVPGPSEGSTLAGAPHSARGVGADYLAGAHTCRLRID